jgi:hypothetical protein
MLGCKVPFAFARKRLRSEPARYALALLGMRRGFRYTRTPGEVCYSVLACRCACAVFAARRTRVRSAVKWLARSASEQWRKYSGRR